MSSLDRHDAGAGRWIALALSILLCLGVSGLGALATDAGSGSWYAGLDKAFWNPPAWVFAPVWTVLYITLGIALWIVWQSPAGARRNRSLQLFFLQLAINLAWSWLFFGLEAPLPALIDLAALLVAVIFTMRALWRDTPFASLIMLPYLVWCGFAFTLNGAVVVLN